MAALGKTPERHRLKTRKNPGDRDCSVSLKTVYNGTATNRGAGSDQEAPPCLRYPPALMPYRTELAIP
jgi:hypothetical protein